MLPSEAAWTALFVVFSLLVFDVCIPTDFFQHCCFDAIFVCLVAADFTFSELTLLHSSAVLFFSFVFGCFMLFVVCTDCTFICGKIKYIG
jgi:hypothetical protein